MRVTIFSAKSDSVITDDDFSRFLTLPNVVITGHQAFFTEEAQAEIAKTMNENLTAFAADRNTGNDVR